MSRSLSELDAVLMVARYGKFRAAALELGVSTTALSNAVGIWSARSACGCSTGRPGASR
ncbi:hypothetical protein [Phenylobacterium sp. J367]|uniref:hypothetical protein n=1 Tax=Phenylobacterium sp. J367 TaxID=2898435 RepID=UPI002151162A|nr:hypothetical protein [Phenylobacterium sp. J367]MCR5879161.1 hypothetical protein [Phenylobacterium sp. J367]